MKKLCILQSINDIFPSILQHTESKTKRLFNQNLQGTSIKFMRVCHHIIWWGIASERECNEVVPGPGTEAQCYAVTKQVEVMDLKPNQFVVFQEA